MQTSLNRSLHVSLLTAAVVFLSPSEPASAAPQKLARADAGDPAKVAVAYLRALDRSGNEADLDLLLGGTTLTAEDCTLSAWRIIKRETPRRETGDLAAALGQVKRVRAASENALLTVLERDGQNEVVVVGASEADALMAPTRVMAAKFKQDFPLFAYLARADKEVFWHPSNPFLSTVDGMGQQGRYTAELHLFQIEERRGSDTRVWPLRVLRVKANGHDTGWRILPASDWDPDY